MINFTKYFNDNFKGLKDTFQTTDIHTILSDKNWLIIGDFYGIQKFIFNDLQSKSAAKILRAKSAFVTIFTYVLARYICETFSHNSARIISANAGKFEILLKEFDESKFNEIKRKIDAYFIENFCALTGVNLVFTECFKDDFATKEKYKKLRENITLIIEKAKFKKFDLPYTDKIILNKMSDFDFVKLGEILVKDGEQKINSADLGIKFSDFSCDILLDERIKSYVFKSGAQIADFETLALNSQGVEAIAVLKADVDGMGDFIKNSDVTDSFENFDIFSKTLDSFFSIHIPREMKARFPHTYVIFAGGDDLLLVGAWSEILELARFIESEFKNFIKNKNLSISFGIALAKPTAPISYLTNVCEELLERAKSYEKDGVKKDAITLFGETARWSEYRRVFDAVTCELSNLADDEISTAFLYRLLEICDMRKNFAGCVKNALWRSRLTYTIDRNLPNVAGNLIFILSENIKNNPKETKMSVCEFIYKRRKR